MTAKLYYADGELELGGTGIARAIVAFLHSELQDQISSEVPGTPTFNLCFSLLQDMEEKLLAKDFYEATSGNRAIIDDFTRRLFEECNWEGQGGRNTWVSWEGE